MQFKKFLVLATAILAPCTVLAQQSTQPNPSTAPPAESIATRPATTTFFGDTGLWFVPTGEVLPHKKWSFSGYRANYDREQGLTDISHFAVTVGVGVKDRAELFGSFRIDTRVDRDVRPLFTSSEAGGLVNDHVAGCAFR